MGPEVSAYRPRPISPNQPSISTSNPWLVTAETLKNIGVRRIPRGIFDPQTYPTQARRSAPSASRPSKRRLRRRPARAGSGAERRRRPRRVMAVVDAGDLERRSRRAPASPAAPAPAGPPPRGRRAARRRTARAESNGRRRARHSAPMERPRPDRACARRDVGMGEHALGRDAPARAEIARERDRRLDLPVGKGGEPPSWPGLTISIPIEAEFRSLSPFQNALPACQARALRRPVGRSARPPRPNSAPRLRTPGR